MISAGRAMAVVFLVFAALLAGCGQPDTVADEIEIREVITDALDATNAWDSAKIAELTCEQYRERASSFDGVVPPMSTFPHDAVASMGAEAFANNLAQQFTGAPPEAARAVADAILNKDEAAYAAAMKDVVRNSMKLRLDKVNSVTVTGDTAKADITVSALIGDQPPRSQTQQVDLVRVDGRWKDCTAPQSGTT